MPYSLYNTGRICLYDDLRIKQGLDSQSIANLSLGCSCCSCCSESKCLYPFKTVQLNYNCLNNPSNCSKCTRYVQST